MPSQTPRGLPYPLPTDPVSHGADDIRALAEAVDPRLAEVPSAFRGQGLVTLPEGDGQMRIYTPSITYRFDLGPDNFAPDGYLALHFTRAGYYWVGMSAIVWNLSSHGGYAGCYCPHPGRVRRTLSLSLNTSFLAAGRGGRVFARARVRGGGTKIYVSTIEVSDEAGTLLAIGEGVYRYRTGSEKPEGVPVDG